LSLIRHGHGNLSRRRAPGGRGGGGALPFLLHQCSLGWHRSPCTPHISDIEGSSTIGTTDRILAVDEAVTKPSHRVLLKEGGKQGRRGEEGGREK